MYPVKRLQTNERTNEQTNKQTLIYIEDDDDDDDTPTHPPTTTITTTHQEKSRDLDLDEIQTDDFGTCPATSLQLMPLLRYVCEIDQYAHSKQEDTDFSQSTAEKRQELELHVLLALL